MRTINCPRASLHSPNSTPSRHNIFIPAFSTTKTVSTKSITHPAADARRWTHAAATPSGRDQATVRQDAIDSANAAFEALLARTKDTAPPPGTVYLVGTGPGDPSLLTLRALRLMQTADVILYDRLVSDEILHLAHSNALMVYVGKEQGFHTRSQDEIHALMAAYAGAGATVVRLKAGDPFIFGRGGEEQQYLRARGIATVTVPGVTAASGIAAELGIPLTHRGLSTSVRYLTGHACVGGEGMLADTTRAAAHDACTTLVVYMGLSTLPALVNTLVNGCMAPTTPAVAVERGTTRDQRLVFGTLETFEEAVRTAALESPTLLVIGDVVALSPGWELYLHHGQSLQRPCVDWREHHHHQQGAEEQGVRLYGQEGGVLGVEGKLLDGALAVGEHML